MKYLYFYTNSSTCGSDFVDFDLLTIENANVELHSIEIKNQTINKEKGNKKFVHIFKKYKDKFKYYSSYCLN